MGLTEPTDRSIATADESMEGGRSEDRHDEDGRGEGGRGEGGLGEHESDAKDARGSR